MILKILTLKLIFLPFLIVFVDASEGSSMSSSVYDSLMEVMEDRRRLWNLMPPEGTRDSDISNIVCPMINEVSVRGLAVIEGVVYSDFPNGGNISKKPYKTLSIKGSSGLLQAQESIFIMLFTDGRGCVALYLRN